MSLSQFVKTAKGEEGYAETGTNITKYGKWYGSDGQPWCVMFISWCADQAGILTTSSTDVLPKIRKAASVSVLKSWYSANRRLLAPNMSTTSNNYPMVGDVAIIKTSSGADMHAGIIVEVSGNKVTTIEGNYSDKVAKVTYTNLVSGKQTITTIGSNNKNY